MAGIKRKDAPAARVQSKKVHKKIKVEKPEARSKSNKKSNGAPTKPPKPKPRVRDLAAEAESDSDPIIESDTTEHSGDDDGVSWPSDNEEEVVKEHTSPPERTQATQNGESSREAHAKQKALVKERKAAKPNADKIARLKKIWERLRRQSHVPRDERKELVAELFDLITGQVKDFVLKHDAGRVIQTALKYGNLEQRKMIAKELKGEYRQLAESRYAKFTIGKILTKCDDEIRDLVVREFYGQVRRMIRHPEAAWILDDVYRGAASPTQKAMLLSEWYGAEFAIFKGDREENGVDLKAILEKTPEKKGPIMRYLFEMINQLIQKKTFGFTMLHDAMLQYYENVTPNSEEAKEFLEVLKGDEAGDLLKNLAFTKSGSRVVCLAIAYGTAKDRKQLLKVYKGIMSDLAFDVHGHQVLLAALDTIDDTVMTSKAIFSELVEKDAKADLLSTCTHLYGRIPLLYPFMSNSAHLLRPEDEALLKYLHPIRAETSKKDPQIRQADLSRYLSPYLLKLIAASASDLVGSSFGCTVITDVLLSASGEKPSAIEAIIALVDRDDMQEPLSQAWAGRMLKTLVTSGRFDPKTKTIQPVEPPLGFADPFFSKIEPDVVEWATGGNSFVVVGLLESNDFKDKEMLKNKLRINKERLVEAARKDAEQGGKKAKKGKKGGVNGVKSGNAGTRMILSLLE